MGGCTCWLTPHLYLVYLPFPHLVLLPVSLFFRPSLVVQALKSTHKSLTLKAIMMPFFAIYVLAMVCLFNLPQLCRPSCLFWMIIALLKVQFAQGLASVVWFEKTHFCSDCYLPIILPMDQFFYSNNSAWGVFHHYKKK